VLWQKDAVQWVGAFSDSTAEATYSKRYVFAKLDYTELGASLRMNWTFTPRLSAQAFVQPLFSAGRYRQFKQLAEPNTYDFELFPEQDVQYTDGVYTVDPDGSGPAAAFFFGNPDFNLRSLRGNFVLRWEYLPGSSLYFVWTHGRMDYEMDGELNSPALDGSPDGCQSRRHSDGQSQATGSPYEQARGRTTARCLWVEILWHDLAS